MYGYCLKDAWLVDDDKKIGLFSMLEQNIEKGMEMHAISIAICT